MDNRPSLKSLLVLFDEGKCLQEKGAWREALKKYRIVCHWLPEAPEVWLLMGRARLMLGESEEGIRCLRACVRLKPDFIEGWNDLGRALLEIQDPVGAVNALDEALRINPGHPMACLNMARVMLACRSIFDALTFFERARDADPTDAVCCVEAGTMLFFEGRLEEAEEWLEWALERDPKNEKSYRQLGTVLYQLKKHDEALRLFRRWAEVDPGNATARHMIAAYGGTAIPERANPEYVTQLFDRFAASFEESLGRLEYRAPYLLVDLLKDAGVSGDILDAGCGTGWCGQLLRPICTTLIGVDISQGMLDIAAYKKCYDDLVCADLMTWMPGEGLFDAVISSDTLNYFGDISGPLACFARMLKPKGWLAFTLECGNESGPPVVLQPHGRYAHNYTFMIDTLSRAGFDVAFYRADMLRYEADAEVRGHVVLARRSIPVSAS